MIRKISEPVDVVFHHLPISLTWSGRTYSVLKVGLHHTYRHGATCHHIFSVVAHSGNTEPLAKLNRAEWGGALFFRLNLNTDSLAWTLEEVSDGLPD